MSRRRPSLANPGEIWVFAPRDLNVSVYILYEDHRARNGQMYDGINLNTGAKQKCFMSYDLHSGWERLA